MTLKKRFFFENLKIRNLGKHELKDMEETKKIISKLAKSVKHLHVSIDIDAFDKSIAPATGIPAQNGLFKKEVFPLLELIKTAKNLSIDLVELNPLKEGAGRTISLAREILRKFLV